MALARDESFPGAVTSTSDTLRRALFATPPTASAIVAEVDAAPVGFALYSFAYSTVLGRPTLHLEDLYVTQAHRGSGIGLRLLRHLARLAVDRDCGRLEWWVLRTNVDAIRFYTRLGARDLDEIDLMRVDGDALHRLAQEAPAPRRRPESSSGYPGDEEPRAAGR